MNKVFDEKILNSTNTKTVVSIESMLDNYPLASLSRVKTFINTSFSDTPTGLLSIHPEDAVVHRDTITKDMFTFITICAIDNEDGRLDDMYFKDKNISLQKNIMLKSSASPKLNGVHSINDRFDRAPWAAELGTTTKTFAGIFKDTSTTPKYYVIAQAFPEEVYKNFKRKIVDNKDGMTFEELLLNNDFTRALTIAKRNTERIAYDIAKSMQVKIPTEEDTCAYVDNSDIAKPIISQSLQQCTRPLTIVKEVIFNGKQQVGVYNRTIPSSMASKKHYVVSDVDNQITIFNMRNNSIGLALPTTHKKDMNDAFLDEMKKFGWVQKGVDNRKTLMPVILKNK